MPNTCDGILAIAKAFMQQQGHCWLDGRDMKSKSFQNVLLLLLVVSSRHVLRLESNIERSNEAVKARIA